MVTVYYTSPHYLGGRKVIPVKNLTPVRPVAVGYHRSVEHVLSTIDLGGDAAYPPPGGQYPPGVKVGAFYVGGDTPHPWTVSEINRMAAGVNYLLPIWVRSDPFQVNPADDGRACAAALKRLGVPPGVRICLDLETANDPAFVQSFRDQLINRVDAYGSVGTVVGNWPYLWVADPGATSPSLGPIPDTNETVVGRQFQWDHYYDLTWWDLDHVQDSFWAV